jgi:hypothetical protein
MLTELVLTVASVASVAPRASVEAKPHILYRMQTTNRKNIDPYRPIINAGFCYKMKMLFMGFLLLVLATACQQEVDQRTLNFPKKVEFVKDMPDKDHLWIFILAGQSNMAGRGMVEPVDTISNRRILSIDKNEKWIYAKEPLHYFEPSRTGLDCGLSFANTLLNSIPAHIFVGLIPCAVGGSSIEQWLGDSIHREVALMTNFKEKVRFAQQFGTIKGILWHQGESNANPVSIPTYGENLNKLFSTFRITVDNDSLPIMIGQLGPYAEPPEKQILWDSINSIIQDFADENMNISVINTQDLQNLGDKVHFDSKSQRMMGARMAQRFLDSN